MTNLTKNKKAGEKYLSFWMFLNWFLILIFVVIGVVIFYQVQIDIRAQEADILANRLADCFSTEFSYDAAAKPDFNIYSFCGLNEKALNTAIYYFSVNISSSETQDLLLWGGNKDYITQCGHQRLMEKPEPNFAQCSSKKASVVDIKTGKTYFVSILAASNQREGLTG